MNIDEAIDYFEHYKTEHKKDKKYAQKFVFLLQELKFKEFEENQWTQVNYALKLGINNIHAERGKVKKELVQFLKFLKASFSLIPANYNLIYGGFIGLIFSSAFGLKSGATGFALGLLVGYYLDQKALKEGRTLKTELNEVMYF